MKKHHWQFTVAPGQTRVTGEVDNLHLCLNANREAANCLKASKRERAQCVKSIREYHAACGKVYDQRESEWMTGDEAEQDIARLTESGDVDDKDDTEEFDL